MTLTEKSGHLAWCSLAALALARQDGGISSPAQENLFLTRWMVTALKQRRFSRDVTPDIEWLHFCFFDKIISPAVFPPCRSEKQQFQQREVALAAREPG